MKHWGMVFVVALLACVAYGLARKKIAVLP